MKAQELQSDMSDASDPEERLERDRVHLLGHSRQQLELIRDLRLKNSLSLSNAQFLAAQMVLHGFPEAISVIRDLTALPEFPFLRDAMLTQERRFHVIDALTFKRAIFSNSRLMERLYDTEGATLVVHPTERRDIMVVFLTAFNNFGVSTPVLLAILQQCGFSVLFLRDCTHRRFLTGVTGCGANLDELAGYIRRVMEEGQFERLFITGYSSGGYASLFMSTIVNPVAYIGFAIESDFSSGGPPARVSRLAIDLRKSVDAEYLVDLSERVSQSAVMIDRKLFFGERSSIDRKQCEAFIDLPGCSVEMVAGSGHELILDLLERGELFNVFSKM